ncbi:MAG: tetratricopeptide repeat protein [Bdellovibrionaceae bacterium]|nr:tetratricopeptide repeat protein [Pseudobdellovibrionaceae bacterium]
MKLNLIAYVIVTLLASVAAFSDQNNATVNSRISYQDETLHIEFSGRKDWDYSVEKKENKGQTSVEIFVDALDQKSLADIKNFKTEWIKKVFIDSKGTDGKTKIVIDLATDLDVFDYLMESPSRLVVDLFPNSKKVKTKSVPSQNTEKKNVAKEKKNPVRTPATADFLEIEKSGLMSISDKKTFENKLAGIFDGADPFYDRFSLKDYEIKESSIIKSKENYYIPFPNHILPVYEWSRIANAETLFEILPTIEKDNKHARLLETLFKNERDQVFLKTYEWFMDKYPESEYKDIIQNMSIQVHLRLWQKEQNAVHYDLATQKMKDIVQKNPEHAMAEKYSLLLGILAYEKKDFFNSLRAFQNHTKKDLWNKKGSFSNDLAMLGIALSLQNMNQFEDALKTYEDLQKNTVYEEMKAEAMYRKGDVKLAERSYDKAVKLYDESISKMASFQNNFPNAYYNKAQSLFLQDKFKDSLDSYREFIKKFPQDKLTPFAMTRVGELLDILGADKNKVLGAYLETYFRNGDNPSAIVARLRILSSKMKGMKAKEVSTTVNEILELSKKSDLAGIEPFSKVLISEGYGERQDYDEALKLLIDHYRSHPTAVDKDLFSKRIFSNIYSKISKSVDDNNFLDALKIYSDYFDTWLKSSNRLDIKYKIGRAYEQGGVYKPALNYYTEVLNRYLAVKGTAAGKEMEIKEDLPSESELYLRLANVESQNRNFAKAFDYLKLIKPADKMTEKEQIERIVLASDLHEKKGDIDRAILYLTELLKYWKGQPEHVAEPYFILSQYEQKKGLKKDAIESLKRVDVLMNDTGLVDKSVHKKALEQLAKIYDGERDIDQAIGWYDKLLSSYENVFPLDSIRFRLGKLYFDRGQIQKAQDIWNQFKGKESNSWKKMAQEQVMSNEWKSDYKKYIDRIPAMEKN